MHDRSGNLLNNLLTRLVSARTFSVNRDRAGALLRSGALNNVSAPLPVGRQAVSTNLPAPSRDPDEGPDPGGISNTDQEFLVRHRQMPREALPLRRSRCPSLTARRWPGMTNPFLFSSLLSPSFFSLIAQFLSRPSPKSLPALFHDFSFPLSVSLFPHSNFSVSPVRTGSL